MSSPLVEITVKQLAQYLSEPPEGLQLIDVREPEEVAIAEIEGFVCLPLSQFNQWSTSILEHFDSEAETLVICHHGIRSAQMCQWLQNQGFTNVKNITGGIDAYALFVDPHLPRY